MGSELEPKSCRTTNMAQRPSVPRLTRKQVPSLRNHQYTVAFVSRLFFWVSGPVPRVDSLIVSRRCVRFPQRCGHGPRWRVRGLGRASLTERTRRGGGEGGKSTSRLRASPGLPPPPTPSPSGPLRVVLPRDPDPFTPTSKRDIHDPSSR